MCLQSAAVAGPVVAERIAGVQMAAPAPVAVGVVGTVVKLVLAVVEEVAVAAAVVAAAVAVVIDELQAACAVPLLR